MIPYTYWDYSTSTVSLPGRTLTVSRSRLGSSTRLACSIRLFPGDDHPCSFVCSCSRRSSARLLHRRRTRRTRIVRAASASFPNQLSDTASVTPKSYAHFEKLLGTSSCLETYGHSRTKIGPCPSATSRPSLSRRSSQR